MLACEARSTHADIWPDTGSAVQTQPRAQSCNKSKYTMSHRQACLKIGAHLGINSGRDLIVTAARVVIPKVTVDNNDHAEEKTHRSGA